MYQSREAVVNYMTPLGLAYYGKRTPLWTGPPGAIVSPAQNGIQSIITRLIALELANQNSNGSNAIAQYNAHNYNGKIHLLR
jgi:hypothetical protein